MNRWVKFGVTFLFATSAFAKTPTFICQEPGGKRLIEIDDNQISHVDGKTELTIDSDGFINDRDGKRLLYVSEDDVRHDPRGVKLATFDGENIRHGPGGAIVLNYHEKEICPDPQSNRIYSIEGEEHLSKAQLVAGMYLLKPELFKLSDAEEAEQKKAMADANAEEEAREHADQIAGKWMMLNSSGISENLGQGTLTVDAKRGAAYPVTLDLTKGGGPTWSGVGFYANLSDDKTFWVAYGTPKTIGLCVYEINGGALKGTWYPWYLDGTDKTTGTEDLSGPASLDGNFKIDSAKAPGTGAAYSGTVNIHPLKITGASGDAQPYSVTWTLGATKIKGIGVKTKNYLVVASGTGVVTNIAHFLIDNGSMSSDWYQLGATEKGQNAATKMN